MHLGLMVEEILLIYLGYILTRGKVGLSMQDLNNVECTIDIMWPVGAGGEVQTVAHAK